MQIRSEDVRTFLEGRRFAVIGASDDQKSFGGTVYRELKAHGYEPVAVNRSATTGAAPANSRSSPSRSKR